MSELRELYQQIILDHNKNPRNFGPLADANRHQEGYNPLCGDHLHVHLQLEGDVIQGISFEGSGCAISVASASLLTDAIIGLSVDKAETIFSAVTRRLTHRGADERGNIDVELDKPLDKIKALDGVREFPSRVKCATLAWHALHSALRQDAQPATTE